jgi:hypothetical protein
MGTEGTFSGKTRLANRPDKQVGNINAICFENKPGGKDGSSAERRKLKLPKETPAGRVEP